MSEQAVKEDVEVNAQEIIEKIEDQLNTWRLAAGRGRVIPMFPTARIAEIVEVKEEQGELVVRFNLPLRGKGVTGIGKMALTDENRLRANRIPEQQLLGEEALRIIGYQIP